MRRNYTSVAAGSRLSPTACIPLFAVKELTEVLPCSQSSHGGVCRSSWHVPQPVELWSLTVGSELHEMLPCDPPPAVNKINTFRKERSEKPSALMQTADR